MSERNLLFGKNLDSVYEYEVYQEEKQIEKSLLKRFTLHPSLIILLTNLFALMVLVGIGIAIGIGISSKDLRTYGETCNKDVDCHQILNLKCQDGKCNCSSTQYYKSIKDGCINKLENLAECVIGDQCTEGQHCINGLCQCTADRWWNSSTAYCQKKSEYAEYCLNISNCVDGKNLVCKSSKCICSNPNIVYWNGTYCDLVQTHLGSCKIHEACNSSQKLVCNNTETQPNKCTCTAFEYWDSTNKICTSQKSINQTCLNTNECKSFTGLYCGSTPKKCICETDYYWSSTACIQKNTYGEKCGVCDDTVLLSCNPSNFCDCSGTNFWNGTYCVPPISIGMNCENNWDCDTSKGLTCSYSTTPHKCVCPFDKYWNISYCADKKTYELPCTKNVECEDYNKLTCNAITKTCSCLNPYEYWSSKCYTKKTVNTLCNSTNECQDYLNLICRSGEFCECPTTHYWNGSNCAPKQTYGKNCKFDEVCDHSIGLICDQVCQCDFMYFWNGSACEMKKSWSKPCDSDNECMEHVGLLCFDDDRILGTEKTCMCPESKYWNSTSLNCLQKKKDGEPCLINTKYTDCQDYLGLKCDGICKCDSNDGFWDGNKCQKYVTYNKYCDNKNAICDFTKGLTCGTNSNTGNLCRCKNGEWSFVLKKCI